MHQNNELWVKGIGRDPVTSRALHRTNLRSCRLISFVSGSHPSALPAQLSTGPFQSHAASSSTTPSSGNRGVCLLILKSSDGEMKPLPLPLPYPPTNINQSLYSFFSVLTYPHSKADNLWQQTAPWTSTWWPSSDPGNVPSTKCAAIIKKADLRLEVLWLWAQSYGACAWCLTELGWVVKVSEIWICFDLIEEVEETNYLSI